MITRASMTKHIQSAGVLSDKAPDLFRRHESSHLYHGFASFGSDGDSCVLLEVADTDDSRTRGLMGRDSLPECCGMLFKDLSGGSFWMKGCKIPLDIIFLDDDDRVSIKYSMKCDGGARKYPYGEERTAIELPYGFCARHGVRIGTKCNWRTW